MLCWLLGYYSSMHVELGAKWLGRRPTTLVGVLLLNIKIFIKSI